MITMCLHGYEDYVDFCRLGVVDQDLSLNVMIVGSIIIFRLEGARGFACLLGVSSKKPQNTCSIKYF